MLSATVRYLKFLELIVVTFGLVACTSVGQFQTAQTPELNQSAPKNLTLLVPLTGIYADRGTAVRNGFLAAYYHANSNQSKSVTVNIVDSNKGEINDLYQQAIVQGAEVVVGPLLKTEVQQLAIADNLVKPTLALNTIDDYQNFRVKNLYQFGLSSKDEIAQMANNAWNANLHSAVIIASSGAWGQNLANSLRVYWEKLGGKVVDVLAYNKSINLDSAIRQTFKVVVTEDQAMPTIGQDFQVIFLIASPAEARQINPLLKFYLLGKYPIYATSSIYSGKSQPNLDNDLDGITFCDMPWVFADSPINTTLLKLRDQLNDLWTESYQNNIRLYALGIDAYYLALNLSKLTSNNGIAATTGVLYIDRYKHIYRRLNWAKMFNGQPILIK